MQLDDLKEVWKEEIQMKSNTTNFEKVRSNVDEFDRRAKTEWVIGLLACAAMVILLALYWLTSAPANVLVQLGLLAMILCAVLVAVKITWARKTSTAEDWTLATKINIQIEKLEKHIKLVRTMVYWCLVPTLIAVFISSYGGYTHRTGASIPDTGLWVYWTLTTAFFVGAHFFTRYQVRAKMQPMLDQLYALKGELEA